MHTVDCKPVSFSVRVETDCHPQAWKRMTDRPVSGSFAVHATLLHPIEHHFILIWPSVWLEKHRRTTAGRKKDPTFTRTER